MALIDTLLTLLLPTLIVLHLLIAPYTKVEESFNIQATHDLLTYGPSPSAVPHYDHIVFRGAVPRTFIGALTLAAVSKPFVLLAGAPQAQFIVRAVLGFFNAWALNQYRGALARAFGRDVGRWYVLMQASQFHVLYYASRTLPNMFAFGLTTLALANFLPQAGPVVTAALAKKQRTGIFLLVFSGVVFRSEIALLLFTQVAYMLVQPRISLERVVPIGLRSAAISLIASFVADSYFWGKPIWPELAGFYFNAVQGKSEEWGTSPIYYYFTNLLPKLLLNPAIFLFLIPQALIIPALKQHTKELIIPSLLFVAIYSLQPHKEARFIIYVVPPLTAAASLSASYIWTRRSKHILYRLGSLAIIASLLGSFIASTGMLLISSLNYPGGEAITRVNALIRHQHTSWPPGTAPTNISIHMDVPSCMTGVTRFLELPTPSLIHNHTTNIAYDKTESPTLLLEPAFWDQFDYALMAAPELAIGKWEVVATVLGYAGFELLQPRQIWGDGGAEDAAVGTEVRKGMGNAEVPRSLEELTTLVWEGRMGRAEALWVVRDEVKALTGGWWVGPRVEPQIRVLRRVKEGLVVD